MPNYTPDISEFKSLAEDHNLIPVYREISADLETPVSAYLKTATGSHSFLFESVEGGENLARFSMLGTEPSEVLTTGAGTQHGEVDPLNLLRDRMSKVKYATVEGLPKFHGGAVGFLAYDTIRYFEPSVPPISDEKSGLDVPEAIFMLTDSILIFDHVRHTIFVVAHAAIENGNAGAAYERATEKIEEIISRLDKPVPPSEARRNFLPPFGFTSRDSNLDYSSVGHPDQSPIDQGEVTGQPYVPNMTREYYGEAIAKCKQAIQEGEVIQVVFSQRLSRRTPVKPFDVYRSLRAINPSPYMFFLELAGFQIVGASPELLTQVIDGKMAVHPIAGTRPRGIDQDRDDELETELVNDEKEVAEHVMLLDLGRNDVGRVSDPGSVSVEQSFEIEKYSHVMHIVSHVTGDLSQQYDMFDAMKAAFPAGTVSGAAKVRAMQLIAELEPDKRGPYSGAVGYFSFTGNMDTAISLRTMVMKDGAAYLQAGGGIVADSDTQTEYEETLHKMGALMRAIDHAEESTGV
ncbi:MAG TPA: anthranilate synthase component I [Dehalococcoidia bacterium]|jgi:anthranilate synthase component 1|nr:anthranilate synthase component I [Chloroflexota bacterium]MDP6055204.1 anthranilate synthase component I [Dehalococcoidia bacterium]MDP7262880.1 anthranilate synthase component I [Dehalococcoidia bacterium]MDP7484841.1 anthranilate synthase component I [Dehalococcoidia bacterium]HJP28479.1 anthranilate synthase component I [Dehalococcoidia bacterium]|tara:strand:+ start:2378 stop:3931 length:1554 start_codon:yes stop_codon:yes gene_type:complete